MKNIKYVLLVILLFLTINVKAANICDTKEFSRLKELAKKIEFDYDYTVNGDVVDFSIHAVNLNEDLKVLVIRNYYTDDYRQFKGTTEATLNGFSNGERVVITIKGFVPNPCSGETVLTKTVKLPYYNFFYNEKQCEGNEDFKYCKILIDSNINETEYNRQLGIYLANKEKNNNNIEPEKEETKDYTKLYFIIGGTILVIVISSILIANIAKRRKKNKL